MLLAIYVQEVFPEDYKYFSTLFNLVSWLKI